MAAPRLGIHVTILLLNYRLLEVCCVYVAWYSLMFSLDDKMMSSRLKSYDNSRRSYRGTKVIRETTRFWWVVNRIISNFSLALIYICEFILNPHG